MKNAHKRVHPATKTYSCTHTYTKEGRPFNHTQSDCVNINSDAGVGDLSGKFGCVSLLVPVLINNPQ